MPDEPKMPDFAGLTPDNPLYSLIKEKVEPLNLNKEVESMTPDNPLFGLLRPEAHKAVNVVPQYLDSMLRSEVPWEQAAARVKENYGLDPEPYRQHYQVREAKAVQKGEGLSFGEALRFNSLPFGSDIINRNRANEYADAIRRYNAGKATDKDAFTIARYERVEDIQREMSKTLPGQLVQGMAAVPQLVGEFGAAGKVVGLGGKLASGAGLLGRTAAMTPLIPASYMEHINQESIAAAREGRQAEYMKTLPSALGLAYMQNLVLGQLQAKVNVPGGLIGRSAVKGAIGVGEAAGADIAATGLDKLAQATIGKPLGIDQQWGPLVKYVRSQGMDKDSGNHLLSQFATFSLFAGLHDRPVPDARVLREAIEHAGPVSAKEVGDAVEKAVQEAQAAYKAGNPATDPAIAFEGDKTPLGALGRAYADAVRVDPLAVHGDEGPIPTPNTGYDTVSQGERRRDSAARAEFEALSPEEKYNRVYKSEKVDLPNRRAFDAAQKAEPSPVVGYSDADALKALNDKYGYAAGDALLQAKADALSEAGIDAYHEKGDEYLQRGESEADLRAKMEKARTILKNKEIEIPLKDGGTMKIKGADFSFGVGTDIKAAEAGLKAHKAEREARGERARGELRGISEVQPPPEPKKENPLLARLRAAQKTKTVPEGVQEPASFEGGKRTPEMAPEMAPETTGKQSLLQRVQQALDESTPGREKKMAKSLLAHIETGGEGAVGEGANSRQAVAYRVETQFGRLQERYPEFRKYKTPQELIDAIAEDGARAARERILDVAGDLKSASESATGIPEDPAERAAFFEEGRHYVDQGERAIRVAQQKIDALTTKYLDADPATRATLEPELLRRSEELNQLLKGVDHVSGESTRGSAEHPEAEAAGRTGEGSAEAGKEAGASPPRAEAAKTVPIEVTDPGEVEAFPASDTVSHPGPDAAKPFSFREFMTGESGHYFFPTMDVLKNMTRAIFGRSRMRDPNFTPDTDPNPDNPKAMPSNAVRTRAAYNQLGARNSSIHEIATTAWAWGRTASRSLANAWANRFGKEPDPFPAKPFADILEAERANPGSQNLTPDQQRAYDVWYGAGGQMGLWEKQLRALHDAGAKWYDDHGNRLTVQDMLADPYFHRSAVKPTEAQSAFESLFGPKVSVTGSKPGTKQGYRKERQGTQADLMAKGVEYKNAWESMRDFIEMTNREIVDLDLANDKKLRGVDTTPMVRARLFAENKEILDALPLKERADHERQLLSLAAQMATGNVNVAPAFKGKVYPPEVKAWIETIYGEKGGPILRALAAANQEVRNVTLGADASYALLQMLPMAFSNPIRFARTLWQIPRAFVDGSLLSGLAQKNPNYQRAMDLIAQGGGSINQAPEQNIARGGSVLGKIPGVGKAFDAVYGRASQAMTQILDLAKVELFLANEPKDPREIPRLVEAIENTLGLGRMEQLGMSPERALLERMVFLAPGFYRGHMKWAEQATQRGAAGHVARKQLGSLMGGVFFSTLAALYALKSQGQLSQEEFEERLNPGRGKFLMVPIPMPEGKNLEVGFGGLWVSIARSMGNAKRYAEGYQTENPAIHWYRGHAGTLIRTGWDLGTGQDYLGKPVGVGETIAKSVMPISGQPLATMVGEQTGIINKEAGALQRIGESGAGFVGLRSYPGSDSGEYLDKLRRAAPIQFGKKYEDLSYDQQALLVKQFNEQKPPSTPGAKLRALEQDELRSARLTKTLSSEARAKLKEVGKEELPSYDPVQSVRGVPVPLTRERQKRYEEILSEEYEKAIKQWPMDVLKDAPTKRKEDYVAHTFQIAKQIARHRLFTEK